MSNAFNMGNPPIKGEFKAKVPADTSDPVLHPEGEVEPVRGPRVNTRTNLLGQPSKFSKSRLGYRDAEARRNG
jgi:hypothetical protein